MPAVSLEGFEHAYREIGILLRIPGITDAKADINRLVKTKLGNDDFGPWLMIVDNADDIDVLFKPLNYGDMTRLIDFLPWSRKGSTVFTTRTAKVAIDLAGSNVIELSKLGRQKAFQLVNTRLLHDRAELNTEVVTAEFFAMLAFLALAIIQALAFINKNNCTLFEYISLHRASEGSAAELLSREFEDPGRYRDSESPVATTWFI